MNRKSPLTILLLCDDDPREHAGTTLEHIDSFARYSRHRVFRFNPRGVRAARLLRLADYDVVVIHHSLVLTMDEYVTRALREQISRHRGLTVCFRQDEYRWVDATNAVLRELAVDVLFSVAGRAPAERLYAPNLDRLEIVQTLTGWVPEGARMASRVPLSSRPIDVGYRGRTLPYWLGRFAQEKAVIGEQFLERARRTRLVCDIGWDERDRIYGNQWTRFLESCRSTLGTESGASIADFDGSVERAVRVYLAERPNASFDEVHAAVLKPHEGNVVVAAISPRVFEAAAAWTPMVLFPGEYSGVIEPGRHYLPLEKDFSNFDDVIAALEDEEGLDAMAERVHADVVASGRYSHRAFIDEFDKFIEQRAHQTHRGRRGAGAVEARHFNALRERGVRRRLQSWAATRAKLARLVAAAYLVVEHPSFRMLWRNYIAHPSLLVRARPRVLVRDLLRLSLARRLAASGEIGGVLDSQAAQVRVRSGASSTSSAAPIALRTIVWEFDGTDDAVVCVLPGGWTMLVPRRRPGETAYRFEALEFHSRVAPERVWRALGPLVADSGGAGAS